MFPMDQDSLLLAKFFVFFTCICFWLKILVDAIFRHYGIGRYFSRRNRF